MRPTGVIVLAAVSLFVGSAASAPAARAPIVLVVRHGGLCVTGAECRFTLRIGDLSISGTGYRSRQLQPKERLALLHAIARLDRVDLRAHPFRGTCPTAYDGTESIYEFRGFPTALASCSYDLQTVDAVQLTERLLAKLRPR